MPVVVQTIEPIDQTPLFANVRLGARAHAFTVGFTSLLRWSATYAIENQSKWKYHPGKIMVEAPNAFPQCICLETR